MKIGNLRNTVARGGFWTAWLLLVATGLTPAPAISFCLAFLTVTCAVFPLALGTRRQRIGAVIVLLLGVVLAGIQSRRLRAPQIVTSYPERMWCQGYTFDRINKNGKLCNV